MIKIRSKKLFIGLKHTVCKFVQQLVLYDCNIKRVYTSCDDNVVSDSNRYLIIFYDDDMINITAI